MEAEGRNAADSVNGSARDGSDPRRAYLDALRARPAKYDYWQVLRRLEAFHPEKPRLGTALSPSDTPVRIGQEAAFDFATSNWTTIEDLPFLRETVRLRQRIFGLLGPNGPLPLHLTEFTRDLLFGNDADKKLGRELRGFFDFLIQRPATQFYRAWAQAQSVVGRDRVGEDSFGRYVAALCGELGFSESPIDGVPRTRRLYFAGWLGRAVRSAEGLGGWLNGGLGVPVEVNTFQAQWLRLPDSERSRWQRGAERPQLARGATLGSRVWDRQQKFRITIGPMSADRYASFLPRRRRLSPGGRLLELRSMVRRYVGHELDWEVELRLAASDVPRLVLGGTARLGTDAAITRLGYGAWLGGRAEGAGALRSAESLCLNPEAMRADEGDVPDNRQESASWRITN